MGKLELGDYGPLFITCLHLDHRTEPKRIRELKEIIRKSYEPRKEAGHIWAGDFNSLTREDYTIKEWNEIARVRSLNCWEKPRVELTDLVKKQDFQDTWQLCPDTPLVYDLIGVPARPLIRIRSSSQLFMGTLIIDSY